ncbi:MAG: chorismate synthase [Verrucomicrobiota bacterium JB024]|nr:chorismate synthase [Verrucomicrobiota bacterium JB024]
MGNSFGNFFRISTWGESHGGGIGVVIDGCPPNLPLSVQDDIQPALDRRRPGQSDITTPRKETDTATIVSGVFEGLTLGTPIAITVPNSDHRPEAYAEMKEKFRPSHADYTYQTKYGIRNHEGGGRSSARETIGRVAAGAVAQKALQSACAGIEVRAYVERIHTLGLEDFGSGEAPLFPFPSLEQVEATAVRCPDADLAAQMIACIKDARSEGDSVGGVIVCRVRGLPVGLGEPVFDRLEAELAKAMLSLPATKAFEIGSGFAGTFMSGSQHNDLFENREGQVRTRTNRSGGVQGGISNGEELYFRVGFKPTATILQPQATVDQSGAETELIGRGRHDPCVVPRAVPIVEAMTWLVLADQWMAQQARLGTAPRS